MALFLSITVSVIGSQQRVRAYRAQQSISPWPWPLTSYSCTGSRTERVHTRTNTHKKYTRSSSLCTSTPSLPVSLLPPIIYWLMSPLHSAIKILLLYLFFFFPLLFPPSGGKSAASALCLTSTLRTHTHTHIDWVNKIKGRMTWFSLCLFTAVNTHILFWGGVTNTHTNTLARKCSDALNCMCAFAWVCEHPWIAVESNEGVSHHDSSSLNSGSWLEFLHSHVLMCFSHLPTFHLLTSLGLLLPSARYIISTLFSIQPSFCTCRACVHTAFFFPSTSVSFQLLVRPLRAFLAENLWTFHKRRRCRPRRSLSGNQSYRCINRWGRTRRPGNQDLVTVVVSVYLELYDMWYHNRDREGVDWPVGVVLLSPYALKACCWLLTWR